MKRTTTALVAFGTALVLVPVACSDSTESGGTGTGSSSSSSGTGGTGGSGGAEGGSGGSLQCGFCVDTVYTPCDDNGLPGSPVDCPLGCLPASGCATCVAGTTVCVDDVVHDCPDGTVGDVVQTCDVQGGFQCSQGECKTGCEIAAAEPSNAGCEFWAADLDQQDAFNDPASAPWGVVLSNASDFAAEVTIEYNDTAPAQPPAPQLFAQLTVQPGQLEQVVLPTRELDCGTTPNDYGAPGTCLSSRAYRIQSTNPIVVYQFNVFENAYSNDASLLLPTSALGHLYRVINWSAGHPVPISLPPDTIVDRSYVTVVGVSEGTHVQIRPSWRVRGNGPIPATPAGGLIELDIGAFDVINIETDDATQQEGGQPGVADLTGTTVEANQPVAVFSGVESTDVPKHVTVPTFPGWSDDTCCLDHLEEQLFPLQSLGSQFVITRSPVRSTGNYHEPDVLRFVGAAAATTVTTSLPAPFDSFTLQPGQVVDTWADTDVAVSATEPLIIGQLLVSQGFVQGAQLGDPALTVFPPVEQYRSEYVFLIPASWTQNWVVIAAQVGSVVTINGNSPVGCVVGSPVSLNNVSYEARRCPLSEGVHQISGDAPFGIIAYGYGEAGSYAFVGGTNVRQIYQP